MRGELFLAFRSNAGGALLAAGVLILSPWILISGLIGRWWITGPDMNAGFYILLGIFVITVVQWLLWITVMAT